MHLDPAREFFLAAHPQGPERAERYRLPSFRAFVVASPHKDKLRARRREGAAGDGFWAPTFVICADFR
jgi:hypothetical protein